MTPSHDPITLFCGGVYTLLALYAAGLWAFALFRTGMVFCYFYIIAALVGCFHFSCQRGYVSRSVCLGTAARQSRLADLILLHHCHISEVAHQEV